MGRGHIFVLQLSVKRWYNYLHLHQAIFHLAFKVADFISPCNG